MSLYTFRSSIEVLSQALKRISADEFLAIRCIQFFWPNKTKTAHSLER